MTILSPSILSADPLSLNVVLNQLKKNDLTRLHFDVMDGHFVPNLSFGPALLSAVQSHPGQFQIDAHLMVKPTKPILESFLNLSPRSLIIHPEACDNITPWLDMIPNHVMKGIAIKPNTTTDQIKTILPQIDLALIMTVEPGFGGQKLLPDQLKKVGELQSIQKQDHISFEIGIDGGIHADNIAEVVKLKPDFIVCGNALVGDITAIDSNANILKSRLS